jgi:diamine N-acetyltransferase
MNNLAIRPWSIADVPVVREIAWKTWLVTYASFIPEADLRSYLDEHYTVVALTNSLRTENLRTFIAEIDSNAVGFSKTYLNADDGRFYVASLYVLPEHQGKGVGAMLMKASETFALTFGVDEIWLGVMDKNLPTLAWYKKLGFQFVHEAPFTMGTTTVNHLIGFKTIAVQE